MGYLSQRKKSRRESLFLQISSIVFIILAVLSFMPENGGIFPDLLFHFYFLNLALFIYAAYIGRFLYCAVFLLLLIVNYFHVAAFANIFFNSKVAAEHSLSVQYTPSPKQDLAASDVLILRSGHLELAGRHQAYFWAVEKNDHAFNIIRVDFSKSRPGERRQAFKQLAAFIETQDDAVIVYGKFGEAAWSHNMSNFLKKTGLKARNHLIFADKGSKFNLLAVPQFYVLSFSNLGVEQIDVSSARAKVFPTIQMKLGFE